MNEKIRKDIESTLTGLIADLKPAPAEPVESKLTESVYFDYSEKDNTHFLALLTDALKNAKTFEIHCWNEETDEIALALKYGKLKESDWTYGKIITGEVTITALSIFFSVHYLTLYYLIQPYNAGTEIKSGTYQLVIWLTYMICYMMIQIKLPTLYFGIAAIVFCVLYSAVASVLVYKLAPKTFRIRT